MKGIEFRRENISFIVRVRRPMIEESSSALIAIAGEWEPPTRSSHALGVAGAIQQLLRGDSGFQHRRDQARSTTVCYPAVIICLFNHSG